MLGTNIAIFYLVLRVILISEIPPGYKAIFDLLYRQVDICGVFKDFYLALFTIIALISHIKGLMHKFFQLLHMSFKI